MNEFVYVIIDKTELQLVDINELLLFSAIPVMLSKDGIHVYIKYKGSTPKSLQNLTTKSQEYTREQMQIYFDQENWSEIPYY